MHWDYRVTMILSLSILIAGIIGIVRFTQIRDIYRPFVYLVWIACAAETLNIYLAYAFHNNLAVGVVYNICESLFLLWFFNKLGIFKNHKTILYLLIGFFVLVWLADVLLSSRVNQRITYYFDIVYAFTVVLLSIRAINDLLFTEKELLKNPTFLICMGLIIFFTYQIIQRMFGLYGLKDSAEFRRSVQRIMAIINCLANLIYAVAILWMRKRQPFRFQF